MITIPPNDIAVLDIHGFQADGTTQAPVSGTITVSDPSLAYANYTQFGTVMVVPKVVPQGIAKTFTITAQGTNQNGDAVTPATLDVTLEAVPFPNPATEILISVRNIRDTIGVTIPPDAGASIALA